MNRRNFFASLIALPAGLMAAAKACDKPAARQVWFLDFKDFKIGDGPCSLTRAAINPLTPSDLEAMGKPQHYVVHNFGETLPRTLEYRSDDYERMLQDMFKQEGELAAYLSKFK